MIALARHMLVLCILLLTCGSHTVCCGAMEQDPPKPSGTESMHVQGQTITVSDVKQTLESFGDVGEVCATVPLWQFCMPDSGKQVSQHAT